MSKKHYAILASVVLVLGALLAWAANAYGGAMAEARLLERQRDEALDSLAVAHQARGQAMATSDSLIALQGAAEQADSVAIAATQDTVAVAEAASDRALAEAMVLAEAHPIIQAALVRVTRELREEREARDVERATSAAALFQQQQRNRILASQLLTERDASDTEIGRLNEALSLSMQRSDVLERAAATGVLRQIWQQGRAVLVVTALVLAVR